MFKILAFCSHNPFTSLWRSFQCCFWTPLNFIGQKLKQRSSKCFPWEKINTIILVWYNMRVSKCWLMSCLSLCFSAGSPQLTNYFCHLYRREETASGVSRSSYLWLNNQTDLTGWFREAGGERSLVPNKKEKAWSQCQPKESQESEWYKSPIVPYFTNLSTRSREQRVKSYGKV